MKRLIAIVLAVVLLAGGFGGFAYANNNSHEPMTGQKLVGIGAVGKTGITEGSMGFITHFHILNPDCVAEITIERMSIFEENGTLIWEGPFRHTDLTTGKTEDKTEPMKPHELWIVELASCMPDGDDGWLPKEDANILPLERYIVEVFWTGDKKGCPPIGWAISYQWKWQQGQATQAGNARPMVNMKQKLK